MWREILVLAVSSAAVAYLFYHVLAADGGLLAQMSIVALAFNLFVDRGGFFYKLGRGTQKAGGGASRAE